MNRGAIAFCLIAACFFLSDVVHAAECGRRTAVQWGGPQTRTRCIGYASGKWPGGTTWKTCNRWATDLEQHSIDVVAYCPGTGPIPSEINRVVDGCIGVAWGSAIGTLYFNPKTAYELLTGRLAAFDGAFTSCIRAANLVGGVLGYEAKVEKNNFW
jgi:hypothetical protein